MIHIVRLDRAELVVASIVDLDLFPVTFDKEYSHALYCESELSLTWG